MPKPQFDQYFGKTTDDLLAAMLQELRTANGTVAPPVLSISAQPQNQNATVGNDVTVSLGTSGGNGNNVYQWYKDGVVISGAINSTYTISNAQAGDSGGYYATVTDGTTPLTSNTATITVSPAVIIYWGYGATPTTQAGILAGNHFSINSGSDFNIDVRGLGAVKPWWAQPSTEPAKTYIYVNNSSFFVIADGQAVSGTSEIGNFDLQTWNFNSEFADLIQVKKQQ